MRRLVTIVLAEMVLVFSGCTVLADSGVTVKALRCEYRTEPMGIDVFRPRLSWVLESNQRGQMQSAYQILVASSEENLDNNNGDIWDTGKVNSNQSIHVVYAGRQLRSRMRCYWKVRVWDKDGAVSSYSQPTWWEMGLTEAEDWQAKWLSAPKVYDWNKRGREMATTTWKQQSTQVEPSPLFRKTFTLAKAVKKARVYISGLGYYELYINGKKVGNNVLDPAFTRYDRRVLYVTYDVTDRLTQGKNAVGIVLGNGWYNMHTYAIWYFDKAPWRDRPTMLFQLEVEFIDGSSSTIVSDPTWAASTGPIVFDSIRNGETYDARLEKSGWNTAVYNDAAWLTAHIVRGPEGKLTAQMLPPIKVMKTITPVKLTEPKPGCFVFDLGQNIAGWGQLTVSGPAGTRVVMKYAERLNNDGTVDRKKIGNYVRQWAFQTDTYILKGDGIEIWEPRFAYHGFRYIEVTGFPGKPTIDNLRGRVVHTSFSPAGHFECSNELLNKIQRNTVWSYINNFHGYPTDCPHREKSGWTADAHLAAEQGLYNFASAAAYTKWMNDFKDEQRESGELPAIVPTGGWGYHWGNGPAWDSAYVLIPWYLYQYRGDTRILAEHYDRMKRYVDYLTRRSPNMMVTFGLGDWAPARTKTLPFVTSTGYYYADTVIVAKVARLLGKNADAQKYAKLAEKIQQSFNERFYRGDGLYVTGSQTALSCALYQGLVAPKEKDRVVSQLVANVERRQGHLDTGILGTKYLLNTLTDNGRVDVAYTIATQTTYPSWGHWISQGATTLWEQWNGKQSRNHIMFGDISAWFYKALAGINIDPEQPGFKHIIIRPRPVGDLTWARAEHKSMYGTIHSSWRKKSDRFTLDVTIPANTTATVYMPAKKAEDVTESGTPAVKAEAVKFLRTEDDTAVYHVGSGSYSFAAKDVKGISAVR